MFTSMGSWHRATKRWSLWASLDVGVDRSKSRGVGQVSSRVPAFPCVVSACFPLQLFYLLYFYMPTAADPAEVKVRW
jgi:hypothetical protein